MGAYLSEPVTTKISNDETGKNVAFGASSMQGWRVSQEDAHNCCINFDDNTSLFAVYDGHGGHEVATYCASKLPEFIKQTDAYKRGDIRQALIDAFLEFDATLTKPEIIKILKEISGSNVPDKSVDKDSIIDSDDEDNVSNLKREAEMPLEQVMAKYQLENPQFKNEKFGKRLGTATPSRVHLRCRRTPDKVGASMWSPSSGAGCSSPRNISSSLSSGSAFSSWGTNEADVSSSSTPCASTTVDKPVVTTATPIVNTTAPANAAATGTATVEPASASDAIPDDGKKRSKSPGSSETDQILDSTTSNGEIAHECTTKESTKDPESSKTTEMPDSSVGVIDKVSPSKPVANEEIPATTASTNGGELKEKNVDADCSRGDNVSSSSTMENGEITQQEGISSSSRRTSAKPGFYRNLWDKSSSSDRNIDDDDDDDEDEDENDEPFDAVAQGASDDDPDTDDNYSSDDVDEDKDEELDDDDDDDEDDDDEDDDEDDDDDSEFTINEEPGSDSGCTAVVAILRDNDLYVANAGDSRCVLCRDGEALELSLDHKPEDEPEMKRIVTAGGKVTSDGRVNGGLNLSRALGDHAYKQNAELPAQDQMISALPDVRHIAIDPKRDEFMVLACDGIWNFMSSDDVVKYVRQRINSPGYENLSKICEELFFFCLAPDTMGDGTGCDNMTAVIVKFKSNAAINENNTMDGDVVVNEKKRPHSPNESIGMSDETSTENNSLDGSKRAKI